MDVSRARVASHRRDATLGRREDQAVGLGQVGCRARKGGVAIRLGGPWYPEIREPRAAGSDVEEARRLSPAMQGLSMAVGDCS